MKTEQKSRLLEIWRNPMVPQSHEFFYDAKEGSACALGQVYLSEGIDDESDPRWCDLTDEVDRKFGLNTPVTVSDDSEHIYVGEWRLLTLVVLLNDNGWSLERIADWVDRNVIPDDIPGTIPTEWTQEDTHDRQEGFRRDPQEGQEGNFSQESGEAGRTVRNSSLAGVGH